MSTKNTDLKSLSDAELDSFIEYSINQQETVKRHGDEYQHHLNSVAAAKEEKARRGGEDERILNEGSENKKISEKIPDTYTEANSLADNHSKNLHITPDPSKKDKKDALKKKTPKPTDPDAKEIDPSKVNQGLPGVEPQKAETTPENQNQ